MRVPKGVTPRRLHGIARHSAEWQIHPDDQAGHILLRLLVATDNDPARVEVRTGPASHGPDLSDPGSIRRLAWTLLDALQALADEIEAGAAPGPPDPQLTIYDELELATQAVDI